MTETALRRRFDRKRHFLAFISSSLYFSRMPVATAEEFYDVLNRSGLLKPVDAVGQPFAATVERR